MNNDILCRVASIISDEYRNDTSQYNGEIEKEIEKSLQVPAKFWEHRANMQKFVRQSRR